MLKALADRLAEAFAERLHQRVRTEFWGYASDEAFAPADLVAEKYLGIRPAPGYPACPDHGVKADLFRVLAVDEIGMALTESLAMTPAASVSGFYLSHPEAAYFNVGKIGDDQLQDWARRSGMMLPAPDVRWPLCSDPTLRRHIGVPIGHKWPIRTIDVAMCALDPLLPLRTLCRLLWPAVHVQWSSLQGSM